MSAVLIISRTRMSGGNVCIGGYDMLAARNIRLLSALGQNQPESIPFQVGQIWEIDYTAKNQLTPPHVEDVLLGSFELLGHIDEQRMFTFIAKNCPVFEDAALFLFNGSIHTGLYKSAYINKTQIPDHSVCFWKTSGELSLDTKYQKSRYLYQEGHLKIYFPYVGLQPTIQNIPYGSIVRLSLARWWLKPEGTEEQCYLQISGWYLPHPDSVLFKDHDKEWREELKEFFRK